MRRGPGQSATVAGDRCGGSFLSGIWTIVSAVCRRDGHQPHGHGPILETSYSGTLSTLTVNPQIQSVDTVSNISSWGSTLWSIVVADFRWKAQPEARVTRQGRRLHRPGQGSARYAMAQWRPVGPGRFGAGGLSAAGGRPAPIRRAAIRRRAPIRRAAIRRAGTPMISRRGRSPAAERRRRPATHPQERCLEPVGRHRMDLPP